MKATKAMKIFYDLSGSHYESKALYANITNKCPCACTFCIRKNDDTVGENDSLWLEHEPSPDEIRSAFDSLDTSHYSECVFCGFGEPMERPQVLIDTARYIKDKSGMKIRVNTNGLVALMHPEFDIDSMRGAVDSVSISLNASDPEKYLNITNSRFGLPSYEAMLDFAARVHLILPETAFTVVDVIGEEELEACRRRAEQVGVPLRVRTFISNNREYD